VALADFSFREADGESFAVRAPVGGLLFCVQPAWINEKQITSNQTVRLFRRSDSSWDLGMTMSGLPAECAGQAKVHCLAFLS
jgi:hypothetical protein